MRLSIPLWSLIGQSNVRAREMERHILHFVIPIPEMDRAKVADAVKPPFNGVLAFMRMRAVKWRSATLLYITDSKFRRLLSRRSELLESMQNGEGTF